MTCCQDELKTNMNDKLYNNREGCDYIITTLNLRDNNPSVRGGFVACAIPNNEKQK